MSERTKFTLIQRIRNRMDERSWEEFTSTYSAYIYALLSRSGVAECDLEDCRQEIFLKIWKGIENFEYKPEQCKFRSWLAIVTRNYICTYFKRNKGTEELDDQNLADKEAEVDSIIDVEWKLYIANKALETIRARFGECALASYESIFDGRDIKEVTKEFGIEENTVYVYRKRIKAAMTREIMLLNNDLE